ncbi:MAG: putative glycoside hydrolase [Alkalispirochaetaceae bacterium]
MGGSRRPPGVRSSRLPHRGCRGGEDRPGNLREHWVDQSSPEVWEYNVALAEELAARGVDEIQFDYIRFPSDGPTERIAHPYHREGMSREDALESFLTLARKRIAVPVGVDVFGFNGFYEMDYLGQNIKLLAGLVDVISPMWYPSHFSREFLPGMSYLDWARAIHELGSRRGRLITGDRAIIRPYVQAFLIGGELEMDEPTYRRYLIEQLEGAEAGGSDGYLLWNFSGRYYMVE